MPFRNPVTTLPTGSVLTGVTYRTQAAPLARVEMSSALYDQIDFYTGAPLELNPGQIRVGDSSPGSGQDNGFLTMFAPQFKAGSVVGLNMQGASPDGTTEPGTIRVFAGSVIFSGKIALKTARTALTFGGTVFADFGGSYGPASYQVDATGWVKLLGLAQNTSAGAASGGALVCSGLPHPASGLLEPMPTANGAAASMVLQVDATGQLTILAGSCPAGQNIVLGGIGYQS